MTMTPSPGHAKSEESRQIRLLEAIENNTRVMTVKLFGTDDANTETESGRLPKVEKSTKNAHQRIDAVDRRMAKYAGAIAVILFLVSVASTWAIEYLVHHHS